LPNFLPIFFATYGYAPTEEKAFNNALRDTKDALMNINNHLKNGNKTHLVSNRLTVADIFLAVPLIILFQSSLDGGFRKAVPQVTSWLENFIKHPEVISRIGNVKFCAKAIKPIFAEKKKEEAPKPVAV